MFGRSRPYHRGEVLAEAEQARGKGQHRKAIKGYRKILAVDPADLVVHGKLAPLLARRTDQRDAALASFQAAARGHLKAGFSERATAVYLQAVDFFPETAELWTTIADAQVGQGKRADAVNTLVRGSGHLGKRRGLRRRAIELLETALKLAPFHLVATLELASLTAKQGNAPAAIALLNGLLPHAPGPALRRVRWALFRLSATPASFWGWFRTFFGDRRS